MNYRTAYRRMDIPPPPEPDRYRSRWPKERRHGHKLRSNRLTISRRAKRRHRRAA